MVGPDPPWLWVCYTSLHYLVKLRNTFCKLTPSALRISIISTPPSLLASGGGLTPTRIVRRAFA
jgi:hypothetical protein